MCIDLLGFVSSRVLLHTKSSGLVADIGDGCGAPYEVAGVYDNICMSSCGQWLYL